MLLFSQSSPDVESNKSFNGLSTGDKEVAADNVSLMDGIDSKGFKFEHTVVSKLFKFDVITTVTLSNNIVIMTAT